MQANLSDPAACGGYGVPGASLKEKQKLAARWTLSVHTVRMEIKHCLRCGEPWCYRGEGRPLRCGKCKSPYWDRPRRKPDFTTKLPKVPHQGPVVPRPSNALIQTRQTRFQRLGDIFDVAGRRYNPFSSSESVVSTARAILLRVRNPGSRVPRSRWVMWTAGTPYHPEVAEQQIALGGSIYSQQINLGLARQKPSKNWCRFIPSACAIFSSALTPISLCPFSSSERCSRVNSAWSASMA